LTDVALPWYTRQNRGESVVTFEQILDQAIAMLQRRGRLTCGTLKRQFRLDDAALEGLKNELIEGQRLAVDEGGNVLVWTGDTASAAAPASTPALGQARVPLAYTPPHLAEKILTSKTALEGERKQVTVLFADLKGSMELLADRDPEEARQLLDPVLERMMAAVHRYEGTVNQVMGDGIMALFGAPLAHEDHAVRACYAAMAMQEAICRYSEEVRRAHGITVQIRIGLNSGEVVVRAIGNDLHMDYTAVGQTTHLAARMEQLATPGSTLLTVETLRLAEGFIQVKALGPVPVKGLVEPVEVFELSGASGIQRRLQAAVARGLTRFIGRETELTALQQALTWARAGQGQMVALIGEPGVGKSRLVHEFLHSHRTQGWRVLESSSVSYGKSTAYLPVCDLLRAYCHVEDRDDLRTVRAKITGQLLTLDESLQDTVPALLALFEALPADSPFLSLDPLQRRRRTLEALKRILLRESQVQPLLLVFEDLHWIDTETQAVLDLLVESLPTARVLLLVNYRPEYQHGWGSKTYYTQLRLDPLPPASAEALLQAFLGEDASLVPLAQHLIARTQGNPFFLEESVRALVETGVLVGGRGAYRVAQPLATLQVPATVQALLAARIDRLPPEDKRLLQTAAVIGTEVPGPLLQAIAETSDAALARSLGHLQAAEFLYETSLFPERAYTFKHALTHEVAYGSLLHERRRALHARLVAVLEAQAGDRLGDQVERLAHHALRGEVWDKAVPYGCRAGDKARARSAYREAVVYYEQALAALPHPPASRAATEQAIDLRLGLRNALNPLGATPGQMLDHLRRAETLAQALGDSLRLGLVYSDMGVNFRMAGDIDHAIDYGQRALALAATLGDVGLQAWAHLCLSYACYDAGAYAQAIEHLGWNVATLKGDLLTERFGHPSSVAAFSRGWLSLCQAERGAFTEGLAVAEDALRIAETINDPIAHIMACYGVSVVLLRQGHVPRAISVLEPAMGLCQDRHVPLFLPRLAAAQGLAYVLDGRVAGGLALAEHGVAQEGARGRPGSLTPLVACLSEAYLLAGLLEDARQRAVQALDLARQYQQRGHQAWALWLLGESMARLAPTAVEPAAGHYRQALALAEELGMRPLQAHCHHGLGTLYHKIGRLPEARAKLCAAIELYTAMEMTFWLPQAGATLAAVGGADHIG
jgi:class 3 adenylate cyclase/tetratricopeptide (TPR) repeat protein